MNNIKIIGTCLYQWEIGRQIQIVPLRKMAITSVHFSNLGDTEALVVKPKEANGMIVADVPNILLQSGANLVVYTVNVDGSRVETLQNCVFPVRERAKPADYVYTETEVLTYSSLDKRIADLEGDGLTNAVAAYLKENPVVAGATKEEAEQIRKNKESIETLGKEKLDASKLPEAVNNALAQAKESGEFDGKTPAKGTDYYTEADKTEMVNLVLSALPTWTGGSY